MTVGPRKAGTLLLMRNFRLGSYATDAFATRADQCPSLPNSDIIVRRSEVTLRARANA